MQRSQNWKRNYTHKRRKVFLLVASLCIRVVFPLCLFFLNNLIHLLQKNGCICWCLDYFLVYHQIMTWKDYTKSLSILIANSTKFWNSYWPFTSGFISILLFLYERKVGWYWHNLGMLRNIQNVLYKVESFF